MMGYDVHITRAEDWWDNASHQISSQEWLETISHDPALTLEPKSGPYFAIWNGECSYPWGAWFDWFEGDIHTKNPDHHTLLKMLQLAAILNAKVQGDDGEIYQSIEDGIKSGLFN